MAIAHAQPGQVIDVAPFGAQLAQQRTSALFKSQDLELMRVVLARGAGLPPHKVPGEVTILVIEGALRVTVDGSARDLRAGQLVWLQRGSLHAVEAIDDTSALVTIALR